MSTTPDMQDIGGIQAAIAVTREAEAGVLRPIDEARRLYSVTVPDGYHRETIDLERYGLAPARSTGTVRLQTVDDFAGYVRRHDDQAGTTVWADIDTGRLVAVIDDHTQEGAGWGEHRAELVLKPTEEWRHWEAMNGKLMDQEAFAEHVEDGMGEIVEPSAADLLDIVTTMQGHTNAEWKQAIRLQDGSVQFVYNEEATATAGGRGELEIPQAFTLGIAPFLGEEAYKLTARLRYRVSSGNLKIGYKLYRPGSVRRDAIELIAERLLQLFPERTFIGIPR